MAHFVSLSLDRPNPAIYSGALQEYQRMPHLSPVVKRLKGLIDKMDPDLGVSRNDPGVRPCGKVNDPRPLAMDAMEYDQTMNMNRRNFLRLSATGAPQKGKAPRIDTGAGKKGEKKTKEPRKDVDDVTE